MVRLQVRINKWERGAATGSFFCATGSQWQPCARPGITFSHWANALQRLFLLPISYNLESSSLFLVTSPSRSPIASHLPYSTSKACLCYRRSNSHFKFSRNSSTNTLTVSTPAPGKSAVPEAIPRFLMALLGPIPDRLLKRSPLLLSTLFLYDTTTNSNFTHCVFSPPSPLKLRF